MNCFLILFFCIFALFIYAYILFNGDILSPSIITTFVFLMSAVSVLLNMKTWNVIYEFKATIIIILGLTTAIIAELFVKYKVYKRKKKG